MSAKESEYIFSIDDFKVVQDWVQSWTSGLEGRFHTYYLRTTLSLEEKVLNISPDDKADIEQLRKSLEEKEKNDNDFYFPTQVIFILAAKNQERYIVSGQKIIKYNPTIEFEIIYRKNQKIFEVRGQNQVIKEFVNLIDLELGKNSQSLSSLAIGGNSEDDQNRYLVAPKKIIGISKLASSLKGKYGKVSVISNGTKTYKMDFDFGEEGIKNPSEEEDETIRKALTENWSNQRACEISFEYGKDTYSFWVTTVGGLIFRKYAPEEVLSYVLYKLLNV